MLEQVKVSSALDYASGSADRNGTTLDMQGFTGVLMIVKFATIAADAVTTIKAQQGAASNLSDAADLADTGISVAADDDNQIFVLDIKRPAERYVRLVVDKDATNATAESAVYVQYGPDFKPTTANATDAVTAQMHDLPIEGTA